jgi:hypothetical protein
MHEPTEYSKRRQPIEIQPRSAFNRTWQAVLVGMAFHSTLMLPGFGSGCTSGPLLSFNCDAGLSWKFLMMTVAVICTPLIVGFLLKNSGQRRPYTIALLAQIICIPVFLIAMSLLSERSSELQSLLSIELLCQGVFASLTTLLLAGMYGTSKAKVEA